MNLDQLKEKVSTLPCLPGVYIMRDDTDCVIYVGKAKKLKNRVSQYFQESASHSAKTRLMVSKIHHFDVIVCSSEFEALVLECSLIKQHKPKYNILLKDDKGFPYLRIDEKALYPRISIASKISNDGAAYYGPFGSRSVTKNVLETILKILQLPNCSQNLPRDIGKDRPCLHFHMNNCSGWCQPGLSRENYLSRIEQAKLLLSGQFKSVSSEIKTQMLKASDELNFELAASLRDQLNAVESLQAKQLVATSRMADVDVIGFAQTEVKACFSVLHFAGGKLVDKEYEILSSVEDPADAVAALVKQYYLSRGFAPKTVLLPIKVDDSDLISQLMEQEHHIKVKFVVPQRGANVQLIRLALTNAQEEAERVTDQQSRVNKTLQVLCGMLNLNKLNRIESYDVSNISGTDNVASMVVFIDGKPKRSEYKHFQIRDLDHQDDYASMEQILRRRFQRFLDADPGFSEKPDLLLVDGGCTHVRVAEAVLSDMNIEIPVYGMVKDDRHRTRSLVTSDNREVGIESQQAVFSFVGNIQEETHRFAIRYHKKLRSKRLRYSKLDGIEGIGAKRKQDLLKKFKSVSAIAEAELFELERILPKNVARNVYEYFKNDREGE